MPLTALFMGPQPECQRTRAEREHAHTYCRECPNIFHIYNIIRYNAPGGTPSPAPACPVIKTGRPRNFAATLQMPTQMPRLTTNIQWMAERSRRWEIGRRNLATDSTQKANTKTHFAYQGINICCPLSRSSLLLYSHCQVLVVDPTNEDSFYL